MCDLVVRLLSVDRTLDTCTLISSLFECRRLNLHIKLSCTRTRNPDRTTTMIKMIKETFDAINERKTKKKSENGKDGLIVLKHFDKELRR
jgi:ERCC4-type nuclease